MTASEDEDGHDQDPADRRGPQRRALHCVQEAPAPTPERAGGLDGCIAAHEAVHEPGERDVAPARQAIHPGVTGRIGQPAAAAKDLRQSEEIPPPGAEERRGAPDVPGGQSQQRLRGRQSEHRQDLTRNPGTLAADEDRAQLVTVGEQVAVPARPALHQPAAVAGAHGGNDQHRLPAQIRTAAEVQVLAVVGHRAVEAAEPIEDLGTDQHAGARDGQNVGHGVVLALVVLTLGHQRHGHTHPVRREPDALQESGVVPVHDLRAHKTRPLFHRLVDEARHRIGCQRHVVVADQQERGVVGARQ